VRVELPGGIVAWSVTRHEVIKELTADPRVSRDAERHWPDRHRVSDDWPMASVALHDSFFNAYGEEHRRHRRMVAPAFTPRRVQAMAPRVRARADELVADLARVPPGRAVDLRATLSRPLTMTVICDLMGVPDHLRDPLAAAVDAVLDTTADAERMGAAHAELHARFAALLEYKRRHLSTDLASDLIAPDDGSPMSDERLLGTLFLMIGAGFETAVNLITSAAHALLTHPGTAERLRRGDLAVDDVVEETLRRDGPAMHLPLRYAVEDIDLGDGVVIERGEPILLAFGAAGRDPALHPDEPDAFDPDRASKDHLAFGFGVHFCLGAHLARLEARTALSALFESLPGLALADPEKDPPRLTSLLVHGPSELLVVPRPGRSTAPDTAS
jgi:cytochrome P450